MDSLTPDMESENKVCFISYNSRGFGSLKTNLIRHLVSKEVVGSKIPILCNQENFMLRENSYKLIKALPGYQLLVNPAIKNDLGLGRPKNGMFIAFPNSIKSNVTDVSPGHWRIQAVKIQSKSSRILLINSYFPTDSRRPNADQGELMEILGQIREVIRKNDFDCLMWAGDINAEFLRNTNHTRTVSDTVEELGLTRSWQKFEVDFTCYHELLGEYHTAVLDHFFWSETLNDAVADAGVLHLLDNKSDHSPIYCVLDLEILKKEVAAPAKQKPRPSWKKASVEQKEDYRNILDERLEEIFTPMSVTLCHDVSCRDPVHKEELDTFTLNLLSTVQEVAEMTLPVPVLGNVNKKKQNVPGWREEVKPFKDQAYFWHQIWLSCGRPLNNEVHRIMKRSRNRYHY